jgi:hypothetical protein
LFSAGTSVPASAHALAILLYAKSCAAAGGGSDAVGMCNPQIRISTVIPGLDPGIHCKDRSEITGSRSCDRPGDDGCGWKAHPSEARRVLLLVPVGASLLHASCGPPIRATARRACPPMRRRSRAAWTAVSYIKEQEPRAARHHTGLLLYVGAPPGSPHERVCHPSVLTWPC